jgi:TorA maturation chaperone TorD
VANAATDIIERPEEDSARSCVYRLLGRLLASPPDAGVMAVAASLMGDGSELGRALDALARVARATTPAEAREEYDRLFIGLVRGELVPYASFYLTGFLYERPLAALRADLTRLGIARSPGCSDPEDHIASLCDAMAGLIDATYGTGALAAQQDFFDRHVARWASRFFADLERARSSRLYGPVGTLGRVFMEIEATAFAMAA